MLEKPTRIGRIKMTSKLLLGCGYLGRRVAERWLEQGGRVFGTTRQAVRAAELSALGVEPVICDVLDPSSLRNLPVVDQVVYAVGFDRNAGVPMRQVYVEGLANVLRTLPGEPKIVAISSTSVYGQTDGSEVQEESPTEPAEEAGRIVLEAEQVLRKLCPRAIVLRFAGIYGPGRLLREKDLRAGRPLAIDPDKWLNLIQVEDGAQAVLAACTRGKEGAIYNISDGHPVRRRAFYSKLAELLDVPEPKFVPASEVQAETEKVNRRISNEKMRRELQIEPVYPRYDVGLAVSLK